jgi:hypothetical protein
MNVLVIVIVLVIAAVLLIAQKAKQAQSNDGLAYVRCDVLFTPAERSFLGVLEQALDGRHRVFGKVRLADIISPLPAMSHSKRDLHGCGSDSDLRD